MAPLSREKLADVVNFFTDENVETTLDKFISLFQRKFERKDYFKVCIAVNSLLEHANDLLPSPAVRIAALTLLHQFHAFRYSGPVASLSSPFVPHLLNLLQKMPLAVTEHSHSAQSLTPPENLFLACILKDPATIKEMLKLTAAQVLSRFSSAPGPLPDLSHVRAAVAELPGVEDGVSLLLPHPSMPDSNDSEAREQTLHEVLSIPPEQLTRTIAHSLIRPVPPVYTTLDELVWLDSSGVPSEAQVCYDSSMCMYSETDAEARRLMTRAFKEALGITQLQHLLCHLEKDHQLVYKMGLTPTKLPLLVEHNPLVAIEFLLKVIESDQVKEYLKVLVNMELSLHSMEVVNRLTTSVELPPDFIHLYISNCITTCNGIKDRYMQNRLVRLVCVFLQSLIRNKIFNVKVKKEVLFEVQSFCIDFSRIREAAALFKLLKQLEACDSTTTSSSSASGSSVGGASTGSELNKK